MKIRRMSVIYLVCFVKSKRSKNGCQTKDWNHTHKTMRWHSIHLLLFTISLARLRLALCVHAHLSIWLAMNRRKLVENQNKRLSTTRLSHLGISEWRCVCCCCYHGRVCSPKNHCRKSLYIYFGNYVTKTSAMSNSNTNSPTKFNWNYDDNSDGICNNNNNRRTRTAFKSNSDNVKIYNHHVKAAAKQMSWTRERTV